jgi:glycosyltransferase involved in cell wall biosynthesis
VSHALATTLRKDYGFPPQKLVVVHSGVDTDIFVPNPNLRNLAREAWGIPEKALVFGTLGRLSPMKNHSQLIIAFSELCKSSDRKHLRLVIAGDGPLRASLAELAHSVGVRERVVFAGFSEAPQEIYPAFDVFCFPSTTGETLGIALLEAMSCGCPPIAAAVGGVPEILDSPEAGWLIRSGDENALLSAMRYAAELDNNVLRQLGEKARQRVVCSFKESNRFGELAQAIEETFEKRPLIATGTTAPATESRRP